jgi:hypothetical protein
MLNKKIIDQTLKG